ncbi:MAG: hypothetical protein WCY96_07400 [Candidatus Cloacimonadaceae bacterium]
MSTPLQPTPTFPWGGQSIIVEETNTFIWQSDSSQNSYYIETQRNQIGATISNTGWITSSLAQHTFSANFFTNSWEYKWRIKIRNSSALESIFSDWSIFQAGASPGLTITFPANDLDVLSAIPTYQFSYSNSSGYYSVAYQVKLFTGTLWSDFDLLTYAEQESYTWDEIEALSTGMTLWDSGRIESTTTSVEQPSEFLEVLQYWYKVQISIWDNADNEVVSDIRTFGLLVNSIPQIPIIIATSDNTFGRNVISITNPTPDVGQAGADHNKLYRKKIDSTWELLVDSITSSTTYDNTCRSSKEEEYSVSAVSADGIESSKSTSAIATCELDSYWFTNTTTNATVELTAEVEWGQMQSERKRQEYQSMDEIYPLVCYSPQRFYRGNFQATVLKPTDGTTWPNYIASIRLILDSDSSVIMRTPWGDLYEFDIYNLKISPFERTDQARNINFDLVEVDELVPVDTFTYDAPSSELDGYWVLDPTINRGIKLWIEQEWDGMVSERDRYEQIGLTSEMPNVNYGNKKAMRGGFSGYIMADTGELLYETVMKLRSLIDAKNKKPLIFQTMSADRMYVDIYGFNFEMVERLAEVRKISFEFIELGVI